MGLSQPLSTHTLAAALAAGYPSCLSVEFVESLYLLAQARFAADPRVRLFPGSSPEMLPSMIDPAKRRTRKSIAKMMPGAGSAQQI